MISDINYSSIPFKEICIWSLFSVAVMRSLELLNINLYVLYMLIPGLLFFCFLIYFLLKTGKFLNYPKFILSVFIISCFYHLFNGWVVKLIRLDEIEEDLTKVMLMLAASIIVSSLSYALSRIIKSVAGR